MNKSEETIKIFFDILETFPIANNWQKYLRLENNQKLYFSLFIKKYWLSWEDVNYNKTDVLRRIRMIEFFKYITQNYKIKKWDKWRFFIETEFFRMVIVKMKNWKLELLSFYNFR
jgi:hypothetical protein